MIEFEPGQHNQVVVVGFFSVKLKGTRPFDLTAVKFKVALHVKRITCARLDLFQSNQIDSSCNDVIRCLSSVMSLVGLTVFVKVYIHIYKWRKLVPILFSFPFNPV